MSRLERFRPYPVSAFAVVTLLIWGNRIWLAWTNQEDTVAEKLVWSTPITLFVAAALVILVLQLRGAGGSRGFNRLVKAFAGGTGIYWAIRLPMILAGDWGIPFKAVHTVLAVASVAASAWAWRSLDREPSVGSPSAVGASSHQ
ncbi:MAG: hypothetical protein ABI239_12515 [Aquihabitans sp.]